MKSFDDTTNNKSIHFQMHHANMCLKTNLSPPETPVILLTAEIKNKLDFINLFTHIHIHCKTVINDRRIARNLMIKAYFRMKT
jgi:hypothetical protein